MGTALIETSPRAPAVKMPGVAGIASVAAVLPPDRVGNDEIAERIGVSPEWILERTGIRERRKAAEGASLTELAAEAGRRALAAAGADPACVELVLVATRAYAYAREKGMSDYTDWSYICCTIRNRSDCYEKIR